MQGTAAVQRVGLVLYVYTLLRRMFLQRSDRVHLEGHAWLWPVPR